MLDLSPLKSQIGNAPVFVFGLGISGMAAVRALCAAGIKTYAWDDRKEQRDHALEYGAMEHNPDHNLLDGFVFMVLAPGIPYGFNPHPVVTKAKEAGVEMICDIELFYRAYPDVQTIGITGTNGKSTTTALMTHALNHCGYNATMAGNIGTAICDIQEVEKLDYLVLELSSYQLDLCPTFTPDYAILLNITPDHLDRHGSMKNYVEAKGNVLKGPGMAFIGVDDDFTNKLFNDAFIIGQRKVTPISVLQPIPEGIFVKGGVLFVNNRGVDHKIFDVSDFITLKGKHNYQNLACVYGVLRSLDMPTDQVQTAFETYSGLPHRQYLCANYKGVTFINDSKATNGEAASKALSAYDNIYWIIGGRAKKGGLNGLEIFSDKIIKAYVIGECAPLFCAWLDHFNIPFEYSKTLEAATQNAATDAINNDTLEHKTVLLSPATASWDQYKSFEARGDAFQSSVQEFIDISAKDSAA